MTVVGCLAGLVGLLASVPCFEGLRMAFRWLPSAVGWLSRGVFAYWSLIATHSTWLRAGFVPPRNDRGLLVAKLVFICVDL